MALEAGGYTEKLGNRYESNWIAYQLLRLLEEKVHWVTVEPIGDDEKGVDVISGFLNGTKEFFQCKAGSGSNEYWPLHKLNEANVFKNGLFQISRGNTNFHIVSPLSCKIMSDLSDSACNSNGASNDFITHQVNASSNRKSEFSTVCGYLGLDTEKQADVDKAIYFLKHFKVTPYIINTHTQSELEDKAGRLFLGEPVKLINFLKNYVVEFNRLRQKITCHSLLKDLKESGFEQRIVPEDERISPVIARLSRDFEDSISPFLIDNKLLPRVEINQLMRSVVESAVTLVKAEAGMGKSAFLLELHQKLISEDILSIPIRLDRKSPENNADIFGRSLGFPYSPILSIRNYSSDQRIVFILDQLDAIRWTANHSNSALQVCQELVRQVLLLREENVKVSIVLASREFDLNEDVALSSWIQSLNNDLEHISINSLSEKKVTELISPYEKFESLPSERQNILLIPLWLSVYLTIAKRTMTAPLFNNKLELVKSYWEDRIGLLNNFSIAKHDAINLVDEIVSMMTSKARLSISENSISIGSGKVLAALVSIGVLSKQQQRITFRHQALFDYQVGLKLFNAGIQSPESFLVELGEFDDQTLTKREHVKYALSMLLDFEQRDFCECVSLILLSDKVRFHLKYLALNTLKDLNNLTKPAKLLIGKIFLQSGLRKRFLTNSCHKNPHIVGYLAEQNKISELLESGDEELIDTTLRLLSSIAAIAPQIPLEALSSYVGKSDEWNRRVYQGLCWKIEDDSDEMFELRKSILKLGCNNDFIDWKALSSKSPGRALDLIEMMMEHYKDFLCLPRYSISSVKLESFSRRDSWVSADLKEIRDLPTEIPAVVLQRLMGKVLDFVGDIDDEDISYQWLYKDEYSYHEASSSLTFGVFYLIEESGKQLSIFPQRLFELLSPYMNNSSPVVNYLVANLLLNLPLSYSEKVIEWLLAHPKKRFECGNTHVEPKWRLPGKLIAKFSEKCSDRLFNLLEQTIYLSQSNLSFDRIKWCLESRKKGYFESYWGHTQYFLLPCLPSNRISNKSRQLINVLFRKFEKCTEEDFYSADRTMGGCITSPLPLGNYLSDKSWKKLILTPDEKVNTGRWKQISNDTASEVSVQQFSRSLDVAVRNEPERFTRLALTLPKDISKQYVNAFLYGITASNSQKINDDFAKTWQQVSVQLTERLIRHFGVDGSEREIVRLLDSRLEENGWSDWVISELFNIAKSANDPIFDKLNVRNIEKSDSASEAEPSALYGNSINCTRGIAYRGISHLFWKDQDFAIRNKSIVDSAINDFHPAVKMSCVNLLLPLSNYDEDYSAEKFLELCDRDLRMVCARGAHHFFNNGFEGKHKDGFIILVNNMLKSVFDEVRKEAARQVYARWFFNGLFELEVDAVLNGDLPLKQGCASVVNQFLSQEEYNDRIYKITPAYGTLLNCKEEEVLKSVGASVGNDKYWTKPITSELFEILVQSKAAKHRLWHILHKLEKQTGSISKYSAHLLKLVSNLLSDTSESKPSRNIHIRESSLISVLQRLYDEATEDEDNSVIVTCLDIWDKLLLSDIYTAINAVNELDRGLLS